MSKSTNSEKRRLKCRNCPSTFACITTLRNHLDAECSTVRRFQCEECDSMFMSKYSLKTHVETKHGNSNRFQCSYCNKEFAAKGQLKVHERSHTKEKLFKCTVCGKGFSHRESLVTHTTIHTGVKPYQCEHCNATFSCVGNLIKHRKVRPDSCGLPIYSNKRVCDRVGVKLKNGQISQVFADPAGESYEMLQIEEVEVSPDDIIEGDEIVFEETPQEVESIEFDDNNEEMIVACSDDDESNIEYEYLDAAELDQDPQIIFGNIDENLKQEQESSYVFEEIIEELAEDLVEDPEYESEDIPNAENMTYEDDQAEVLEEIEEYQIQQNSDEVEDFEDSSAIELLPDGLYKCSFCPKQYQKKNAAVNHVKSEHGIENVSIIVTDNEQTKKKGLFTCNFCLKVFSYPNLLKNHEKLHGPHGNLIVKCNCCSNYFKNEKDMRAHLFSDHIDILTCPVEKCGKVFDHSSKVKSHVKFNHSENKKTVKKYSLYCDICGKNFNSNTALSDHIRSNCGRTPMYQCETCKKCFASMGSLKCHRTIHLNMLDFDCQFCDKKFRTKGQLTIHVRSHTKEKTFRCTHCPASFSHRESLITHNTIHTGVKRFECSNCAARFSCLSNFINHRKHHPECKDANSIKVDGAETSVKMQTYNIEVSENYE